MFIGYIQHSENGTLQVHRGGFFRESPSLRASLGCFAGRVGKAAAGHFGAFHTTPSKRASFSWNAFGCYKPTILHPFLWDLIG